MLDSWIFFPINAIMFLMFAGLAVASTLFWLWMLIDCVMNEPSQGNDKLIWVIIIVFTQLLGALIYFFFRRPKRIAPEISMSSEN
ncbi:Phospholipase_D-nuclease N-terminal [Methanococcoides vulcani]|uniref:Phospholipase_D-nuclease N-terminal n=1 Tax=Methanococcoides vulcani TaxID=1353158 RepID=A0A1I0B235_9EURY|nr:PLD nuclease N-terminal domain-containing protein [Methanococcoides vulcani]SES99996.1 Phospholipase_D-nuclease N-terminal [Methanococcoides vulcani]